MITYRVGDATNPNERPACIVHVVNDIGAFGAGFALALAERYPWAREDYQAWHAGAFSSAPPFALGNAWIGTHPSDLSIAVAHLCAQHGLRRRGVAPPLRLPALAEALDKCAKEITAFYGRDFSFHMPRIGCGFAGGTWADVEPLVAAAFKGMPVYVYDLPGRPA